MKPSRAAINRREQPDQVHGRLLEAVHLTGYTASRACDELQWLLRQDRWKQVHPGFENIDAFLATMDLAEFRFAREQRKDLVRQLATIKAGQRSTARLLGISHTQVQRDTGTNVPATPANISTLESESVNTLENPGTNVPAPYYSESGVTIYHGDCRDILPGLERGLMVTDPPYNVGYHYDEYHDALEDAEYWRFLGAVLTMPLVFIHYPEKLFPLAKQFARVPDKVVAWVYNANTPRQWRALGWFGVTPDLSLDSQSYRNPTDKRIRALIAEGREARLYDWWAIEQVKNVSLEKSSHPCQIPTALMMRLLKVTPFEGPVVDPFCGSGTTLVAAQALGRRAIGIDCSEEYCEIAANRLRQRSLELVNEAP